MQIYAPSLIFRNVLHTQNVVRYTLEIAGHCNVSEQELFILLTAAWFHDTGPLFTKRQNHDEVSCFHGEVYVGKISAINTIRSIEQHSMVTKPTRHPEN